MQVSCKRQKCFTNKSDHFSYLLIILKFIGVSLAYGKRNILFLLFSICLFVSHNSSYKVRGMINIMKMNIALGAETVFLYKEKFVMY